MQYKKSEELWSPIFSYENEYEVSTHGRVRSISRYVNGWNGLKLKKGRLLKAFFRGNYLSVRLSKEGFSKQFTVHRLVAETFIDNPENKPTVNHIDGDKTNNLVDNLEWATHSEQIQHAIQSGLFVPHSPPRVQGKDHGKSIPVHQWSLDGELLRTFESGQQAAAITGYLQTGINKCCRGELKKHKGYKWTYENHYGSNREEDHTRPDCTPVE